jgi:ubiquinone/menaquinone biosynthesis C-methylase UbiE
MKEYLRLEVNIEDPDLITVIDDLPMWSAPFGLKLLDIIELKTNIKALDLGCGSGFPLIELAERLGKTCRVYGIDPWERALERVRLKLRVYNIKNVRVARGCAEQMPFENERFDLIVSNNGINNVQDMPQALRECARVCKPGAQMTFTLNTEETMREFYSVFRAVLEEESLEDEILGMMKQIHSKRKPLDEIQRHSEEAGFFIKNIFHDSFRLRFLDGTTMLNHYLIKFWFLTGWKQILKQNDLARVFDRVESRLNEEAEIKGEISLTIPFVTFDCRRN